MQSLKPPGNPPPRKPSRVRMLPGFDGEGPESDRRKFFRTMAGASLPALVLLTGNAGPSMAQAAKATTKGDTGTVRIVRDFLDPRLELVRLLREAAEIEHSLALQYLYGAFSLKPLYQDLVGAGNPNPDDLLGIAVQEMQHLADVNRLLVEVGATPVLIRQDFPYEADIYPFPLNLEPLTRESLAKYTYCEAPVAALDRARVKTADDVAFIDKIEAVLGGSAKPNHVGSLYDRVLEVIRELARRPGELRAPDRWITRFKQIKEEGEEGHFKFFKAAFMGTHKAFKNRPDVWELPSDDERYPSRRLAVNPSAYVGQENQISDQLSLRLAWLGNLHYWLFLMVFDVAYRTGSVPHIDAGKMVMMGPFWALARFLPTRGFTGMPFDQLSMGYSIGVDQRQNQRMMTALAGEIGKWETRLKSDLPEDYAPGIAKQALEAIGPSRPVQKGR